VWQHWIAALQKLARTAREAVVLRYSENLGRPKSPGRMGWSVNAAECRLSRARVFCVAVSRKSQRAGKSC